jgi:D-alanyl-lipoteichoic acid acyltransferase DltB (MBOAT superfamily)
MLVSVVVNMGILAVFKYLGFFADSLARLFASLGLELSWPTLSIVLPVGISFYTFQTMSYTVDVYRRGMKPTRNYLDYLLFVSFFPQLVAGPIERATHLLGQVTMPRSIRWTDIREGGWLILLGYYKKVVMADNLAPFVNEVFDAPGQITGLGALAGLLAFAFQIYGDFSGYTDIARGISRWMGFDLMLNFRMPYFAVSPSDFWRRWHISLSTWLRDYLYIPLGGNRGGASGTYRNLFLTMLLGGLWHGAAWHFVAWGAYHGLLLIVYRLAQGERRETPSGSGRWRRIPAMGLFFMFTLGGWLLFRVDNLGDIPAILGGMILSWNWSGKLALISLALFAGPLVCLEWLQERSGNLLVVKTWPLAVRYVLYGFMVFMIVAAGSMESRAFIYFQF